MKETLLFDIRIQVVIYNFQANLKQTFFLHPTRNQIKRFSKQIKRVRLKRKPIDHLRNVNFNVEKRVQKSCQKLKHFYQSPRTRILL